MGKWVIGFALALQLALPASSALITRDLLAAGDELLTFDTDTGLEWLDLTATQGLSYNQAEASSFVSVDGFRHATTVEVTALFQHAGGSVNSPFNAANAAPALLLLDLLGCTDTLTCRVLPSGVLVGGSSGWASNPADPSRASLPVYRTNASGALGRLLSPGGSGSLDARASTVGNYLVRGSIVVLGSPIPEPNTGLLYGLALTAIAFRVRLPAA